MHSLATIVRWPRAFALLFLFSFVAAPCAPLMAQDEAEEDAPAPELIRSPIGTVVLSSVDQLRNELKHVFELSGQMQVYEAMEGAMKSAGDLKGMDQTKPLGAMLFLRNGFPPTPEVIGFVPVEKIEDLTKTIEMGPVVTKKVGDGHYEIIGIRGEFQVKLENGYAYIMRNKELMEN
ncbi:MAG: hypothetical protein AB8G99_06895, partial [Planctomycetaceae bacterium]